jgi:hypothetical protein
MLDARTRGRVEVFTDALTQEFKEGGCTARANDAGDMVEVWSCCTGVVDLDSIEKRIGQGFASSGGVEGYRLGVAVSVPGAVSKITEVVAPD